MKAPAIILALQFAILLTGVLAGWDAVARLQKRVETAPVFADPLRNATTAVPVDVLDLPTFGGNAKKTVAPRREIEPKNVGPVAPKAVASPKTGSAPKAVQNKTAPPKKSGTSPADALHPGKKTQVMRSPFGTEMLVPLPDVDVGIDVAGTSQHKVTNCVPEKKPKTALEHPQNPSALSPGTVADKIPAVKPEDKAPADKTPADKGRGDADRVAEKPVAPESTASGRESPSRQAVETPIPEKTKGDAAPENSTAPTGSPPPVVVAAPVPALPRKNVEAGIPLAENRPVPAASVAKAPQVYAPGEPANTLDALDEALRSARQSRELDEYQTKLRLAESLLEESRSVLEKDPGRSLVLALDAIRKYRQLGQAVPDIAQWVLGQALASQCWGKPLSETLPAVETMSMTEDGRWLLTACNDGSVRLWDVAQYRHRNAGYTLDQMGERFVRLLFTPDMCWAVGGTRRGTIHLWNTAQANPSQNRIDIAERIPGLRGLEISPDGRWLVAYGGDGADTDGNDPASIPSGRAPLASDVVWVWDIPRLLAGDQEPIALRGHEKPVRTLAISRDSRWLVTGSEDTTARVFDLKSATLGVEQTVLKKHEADITAVAIAPDNSWIATGGRDNAVRLWSMPESGGVPVSTPLEGHLGWISSLAVSPDGRILASASYDKTVRLWTVPGFADTRAPSADTALEPVRPEPLVLETRQGALQRVRFSADGKVLVSQGVDSSLRLWEVRTAKPASTAQEPGRHDNMREKLVGDVSIVIRDRRIAISDFALSGDNRWLILAYRHGTEEANNGVRLWPLQFDNAFAFASEYVQTSAGSDGQHDSGALRIMQESTLPRQ